MKLVKELEKLKKEELIDMIKILQSENKYIVDKLKRVRRLIAGI